MTPARELLPRTVAAFEQGQANGLHRGAQLYVSHRGQTLVDAAFGESRLGVPMAPDTITLWLSAGKPITAVAIAQLQEQGRLQFDDPVCRHVPEFAAGGKEAITLRHVLTHTGGFRDADKISEHVGWDETVRRVCETPLEPGWIPGWQAGYHRSGSWFILCRPGSNVRGPIRELGRFYEALLARRAGRSLSGNVLSSAETVLTMTTRQTVGLYDRTTRHPVDWGLGFYLCARQAGTEPSPYGYGPHASEDTFGNSGAQSSCAFADPPRELVVAWLCNGLPGEPCHQQRAWRINTCLYEDLGLAG